MTRKATSRDVADAAGVSKWTVARAFTPGSSISEHSRERVLAAAERLGYRPNLLARSLSTKTTHQVAVLVDDFSNPYKLEVLQLLTAALQAEDLMLMLVNIGEQFDHANAYLNADQRQVDAVVLLGTAFRDETLRSAMKEGSPPLYVLARESTIDTIPFVTCDAESSMGELCAYLASKGYQRPGFMSGPLTLSTALGRQRYFTEFWQGRGVREVPVIPAGQYDLHAAAVALSRYLADTTPSERIDLLMCENDALAIGAIDAARHAHGLRVPQDLAIAGYDGTDLASAQAFDLTTCAQPMDAMVAALVDMLCGRRAPEPVQLRGRLVARGSA